MTVMTRTLEAAMTPTQLREALGHWGEHPDHPVADWRYEVANDDTRSGYWEWVALRLATDDEEEEWS